MRATKSAGVARAFLNSKNRSMNGCSGRTSTILVWSQSWDAAEEPDITSRHTYCSIGFDISFEVLSRYMAPRNAIQADIENLPIASGSVDFALSVSTLAI